jgi:hypothetical protein
MPTLEGNPGFQTRIEGLRFTGSLFVGTLAESPMDKHTRQIDR